MMIINMSQFFKRTQCKIVKRLWCTRYKPSFFVAEAMVVVLQEKPCRRQCHKKAAGVDTGGKLCRLLERMRIRQVFLDYFFFSRNSRKIRHGTLCTLGLTSCPDIIMDFSPAVFSLVWMASLSFFHACICCTCPIEERVKITYVTYKILCLHLSLFLSCFSKKKSLVIHILSGFLKC